jgi:cysteine desulfuration protein SufE
LKEKPKAESGKPIQHPLSAFRFPLWRSLVSDSHSNLQSRLTEIVAEFADSEPRERLELLLDYAEHLPELPEPYRAQRDAGEHRVHECMTPVFLWVEVRDGRVAIFGDVAPESPTVKGFVALLVEAFSGAKPEEVLDIPADLVQRLGLVQALGMVRMRGLHAILHRIRQEIRRAAEAAHDTTSE